MINFGNIQEAWKEAKSIWGKACILFFYSFLFIEILGAAWSLFDTTTGWECLWETLDEGDVDMVAGTMKVVNFWILGFMLYAYLNNGGIAVWNVLMVFVFYLGQFLMYKPVFTDFLAEGCPDELSAFNITMVVTIIWIALALLCSIINHHVGGSSEKGETVTDESHLLS
mmetsp:Transcript_14828/g.22457  ORF Transcript_14828/g.22457 Transcript_14828/m.22457 type:complete len:169 (-) Transcript_14828:134-640(-)|eukprot:CAMPEP_0203641148 /NCGR_PEP_ID=MMETSP0088-20131115/6474_1 /ASSEMBLY_ACC=CAM_ASM_001087 /TAXON_ID=426623 /ORGANISM="Chaetoceros affinis, Strain CCMP159" /LENGTH=168 /DNA_ID=CAMNT_0050496511 /DNA_START=37 /DNA_END=543 /DNA_ORIENTATION=+